MIRRTTRHRRTLSASLVAVLVVAVCVVTLGTVGGLTQPVVAVRGVTAVPPVPDCLHWAPSTGYRREPCTRVTYQSSGPRRGIMIIVASAGWVSAPALVARGASFEPLARFWQSLGWEAVVVEHTPGEVGGRSGLGPQAVDDVVGWFARIRAQTPSRVPVCAFGGSSGGHLALMLGLRRPDVSCLVGEAAPTDLVTLDPRSGAGRRAAAAFHGRLREFSPALVNGSRYREQHILLGHMLADRIVPWQQTGRFHGDPRTVVRRYLRNESRDDPGGRCGPVELSSRAVHYMFAHRCLRETDRDPAPPDLRPGELQAWRRAMTVFARWVVHDSTV